MNKFCELTRSYSLPVSIAPFLAAFCFAVKTSFFIDVVFCTNTLLLFISVVLLHLGYNLFDDYIDIK
ncbi:MAG: hypothetical protein LUE64_06335, partial [Candidatus Gastranaerophilales bacterium]|nr:hypothetical protein [Candidatus Gastranaerophilales bacterium]